MNKTLKEKTIEKLIYIGRKNKLLRIFAIIGLAVSLWFFRIVEYCRKGTKRFACALFVLLCFMVGNSFAFPVFQEDNGFVAKADEELIAAVPEDKYFFTEIPEEDMPLEKNTASEAENDLEQTDAEIAVPQFSADDWKLVLINKQHPVPEDYDFEFGSIKTMKGTMKCDERIIDSLLSMIQDAEEDGVTLAICSPYRDQDYQEFLFNRKIEAYMKVGMSYMDAYAVSSQAVTVPGASEHQIGLAFDIVSDKYTELNAGFAETDAGKWLAQNSSEYGFILRYPLGKEDITGIEFEPWHFRYVGKDAATIISEEGITLEEFWDKYL
ncbi:MAG: D-alanyl-D-alanine carboxypeptidase family protein [Lachnospiraceae bacterium]|nr:D-alanyl-D-alanine carboxypeptidase family protein [Lachnospiraceae bacterium]MBD5455950.1 D-alanyl-D-alanine carboxypeptidase family protein [Lachnospiraceae bacterium]